MVGHQRLLYQHAPDRTEGATRRAKDVIRWLSRDVLFGGRLTGGRGRLGEHGTGVGGMQCGRTASLR